MAAVCARPSCRKPFDPDASEDNVCHFHAGSPLFHEGLKSWTCCSSVNKPVLTFEEFEAIPPCAVGTHTLEAPAFAAPAASTSVDNAAAALKKTSINGHTTPAPRAVDIPPRPERSAVASTSRLKEALPAEDPPDATPAVGAACKRSACKVCYDSGLQREADECVHHPGEPLFHEGSKGWTCCKRRVLDFADFLAIEGCTRGRHIFVGAPSSQTTQVAAAPPRVDHYQTQGSVIASIFLKAVDASQSSVSFEHWSLSYDLITKSNVRAQHSIDLFGPIDPEKSTYKVLGTKVEITLAKLDGRSWPMLELDESNTSTRGSQFTFGSSGPGTIGSKQHGFQAMS